MQLDGLPEPILHSVRRMRLDEPPRQRDAREDGHGPAGDLAQLHQPVSYALDHRIHRITVFGGVTGSQS